MSDNPESLDSRIFKGRFPPELTETPPQEITGVVEPTEAAIVSSVSPEGSFGPLLLTRFERWRLGNSPIRTTPLRIVITAPEPELIRLRHWFAPHAVRRIRATLAELPLHGSPHTALLREFIGPDTDPELNLYADEMSRPLVFQDPVFGNLTFDRAFNWYTGKATWNNHPIKVYIETPPPVEASDALRAAHKLWQNQPDLAEKLLDSGFALVTRKFRNQPANRPPRASIAWRLVHISPDGDFQFESAENHPFPHQWIRLTGNANDRRHRLAARIKS